MNKKIRVCVIGAGTAGLSAVKNSLEHHMEVVCYEREEQVGGTWVYRDTDVSKQHDEEVHSSMYEGLRTNIPKEVMGYSDFPYPEKFELSFVTSANVLEYLNLYADHFKLRHYIKLQHEVIRVKPRSNKEWEVHVLNHNTNTLSVQHFDRIFVCNGHFKKPQYPDIPGMDIFKGLQLHSHLYRSAQMFKDKKVLIIGAGPSGMDITQHIAKTAKQIFLSHHLPEAPPTDFMGPVRQKPDVKYFTPTGAVFKDDSVEDFDCVVYCTGYQYSFPFLSCDCGIYVQNKFVQPLYKHCINIEYPTMAIIGLPFAVLPTLCLDMQIRFVTKFFSNEVELPSKQEMLDELTHEIEERKERGIRQCEAHKMGAKEYEYYRELCAMTGITNMKPVVANIMKDCGRKYIYELETYRNYNYKILDDEHFVKFPAN
ncbi:senecionine N-oxygenase-like [Lucilia sericata]|uniref:senecionine N-oxygenase-like n=1 Tax=Lucilia sericata TaxID=13632 RepID=UPI0018A7F823|nr:senecionine N-oxygenase-like [Lucilia sericata]